MTIIAKRYSRDVFRILEDGELVGFAIRLTNGKWSMTDSCDRKMDTVQYGTANEVAKCFSVVRALEGSNVR